MIQDQPAAASGFQPVAVVSESDGRPKLKTRIDYLDGIRGLAALAVVILHAFQMFGFALKPVGVYSDGLLTGQGLDRFIPPLFDNLTQFGAYAVEIFIVISGYSLMLAVARSQDGRPKGGLRGYFTRRVKRIWPPYYAALALSLLFIVVIPGMNTKSNVYQDLAIPVTVDGLIAHVFFLQYLRPEWFFQINVPMWTVALEEHIYVLFPFVLLPLWRRLGTLPMLLLAMAGSVAFWYVMRPWFESANFWFVGLFAMGATAASIGFSSRGEQRWQKRLPWGKLGILLVIAFYALVQYSMRFNPALFSMPWIEHFVLGAGTACLLIAFTEQWKAVQRGAPSPRALAFLRSRPVVGLGIFSYSLYLMHAPILAIVALITREAGFISIEAYLLITLVGIPIAVIGAYLFHRVFERPFMPRHAFSENEPAADRVQVHQRILASLRAIVGLQQVP